MDIELFGAPRVSRVGVEIRLPVKKCVALLAYVAVERRVTRAKLAALLWAELDHEAARRNLRRELHRLREAQLGDALHADDDHVTISDSVRCDVALFLTTSENDAVAALAAYHGPLLDGFDLADAQGFNDWLAAKRDELGRRWSQVAAGEAARQETRGDARAALELHARLVEHDPLQESHYANAMRLSYLLGERSRALEWYERLRAVLRDELGLHPLPETAALAEQVRVAEQLAPLVARSGTAGIARFDVPFVGRASELEALRASDSLVVLLLGEPGVGKSRLAREFVATLPRHVTIACKELARQAALHAVGETLRTAFSDVTQRATVSALPLEVRQELARLAPVVLAEGQPLPAAGAARRAQFFDALATALSSMAIGGALWVDDLHWADDTTIELLDHLVHRLARDRNGQTPRILLVARERELTEHASANQLVVKLERERLLKRFVVDAFDGESTLHLVRSLSGSAQGQLFAQRLQRVTLGNPYFLLETLRFLFDSGELALDDQGVWTTRYDDATTSYLELPVPPTVQQAVRERVDRLGPAARRVLETAALAGEHFTLEDVQPATALSDWEALDGLERALNSNVVTAAKAPESGYRFAHDLARGALETAVGAERRRLIHRKLGETLESKRGAAHQIAQHFERAGLQQRAVPWRCKAGNDALAVFAQHDALAHFDQGLADGASEAEEIDLRTGRATVLQSLYRTDEMSEELGLMAALAHRRGDHELAALTLTRRAALNINTMRPAAALEFCAQALAYATTSISTIVNARLYEGVALMFLSREREAKDTLLEALRVAPADGTAVPTLHSFLCHIGVSSGDYRFAQLHFDAGIRSARALNDRLKEADVLNAGYRIAQALGDNELALQRLARANELALVVNSVNQRINFLCNWVVALADSGDLPSALQRQAECFALCGASHEPKLRYVVELLAARVALLKGQLGDAVRALHAAAEHARASGGPALERSMHLTRAHLLASLGAAPSARAALESAVPLLPGSEEGVCLAVESLHAKCELLERDAHAALKRIEHALSQPAAPDDSFQQYLELAHVVRGAALLTLERHTDALEAVQHVRFSPALKAIALSVQLPASSFDRSYVDRATALLETERVPPLERWTLLRALAARHPGADKQYRKLTRELTKSLAGMPDERPLFAAAAVRQGASCH